MGVQKNKATVRLPLSVSRDCTDERKVQRERATFVHRRGGRPAPDNLVRPYRPSSLKTSRQSSTKTKGLSKIRAKQGDNVLINMSNNGRNPDIATRTGIQPLPPVSPDSSPEPDLPSPLSSPESHVDASPSKLLGRPIMPPSPYYPYAPNGGSPHRPSVDYDSESTSSDQSVSTTATSTSVVNRMSIEGMAFSNHADYGQYVCTFEGCKAAPFQTQYLLNSHALIYSQA